MSEVGCALGVDLALARWSYVGLAALRWRGGRWTGWRARFPRPAQALEPEAVAEWVDAWARRLGARAVGLDGPASWRDPATPAQLPGVGRRADYAARAQAKVGVWGTVYPSTQLRWTRFCVDVFSALLARPGVRLVDRDLPGEPPPGYWVAEVFPTACWRASGLTPLPSKRRVDADGIARHARALRAAYGLPRRSACGHDDLQASVAALPAAALVGGPAELVLAGSAPRALPAQGAIPAHRVEGYVLNARPLATRRRGSPR